MTRKNAKKPGKKKVTTAEALDGLTRLELPTAKKPATRIRSRGEPSLVILAQVRDTPEVNKILKSNEAKLYLKGIERANSKLQAMIERELALRHHPGHPDHLGDS